MCPTSKKCLYAVHLTHTLCTLKAQLYFLWSQWHPQYFRCPCCDCRVCVFIGSHHFRNHLPDLLWRRLRSWDLCGLRGFLCRVSIWGCCAEARADSSWSPGEASLCQSTFKVPQTCTVDPVVLLSALHKFYLISPSKWCSLGVSHSSSPLQQ